MKTNKTEVEKKKLISAYRSEYYRKFGTVITVIEESVKPILEPNLVDMEKLEHMMLPFLGDTQSTFINKSRKRNMVELRMIFMKILRNMGHPLQTIGNYCKRDHSTVLYNINTANNLLQTDEKFKDLYDRVMTSIRLHLKFEKRNGKTITTLSDISDYLKPTYAHAAHTHEDKTRKSSPKRQHRVSASYKHGVRKYRVPTYRQRSVSTERSEPSI